MAHLTGNVMTEVLIGNSWATIDQISIERPMQRTYTHADTHIPVTTYGVTEMTFSGMVIYTPEVLRAVEKWMYGGGVPQFPHHESEFMCLHCGSPQPITLTHCKQCGAPRSFILG